jgi:hypothetical protein
MSAIPRTFDEWKHCIEVECQLRLTSDFVSERLRSLGNPVSEEAQRFIRIYGRKHWSRVVSWFQWSAQA